MTAAVEVSDRVCNPCATPPRAAMRCQAVRCGARKCRKPLLFAALRECAWLCGAGLYLLWEQGVAGSNPAVPIGNNRVTTPILAIRLRAAERVCVDQLDVDTTRRALGGLHRRARRNGHGEG